MNVDSVQRDSQLEEQNRNYIAQRLHVKFIASMLPRSIEPKKSVWKDLVQETRCECPYAPLHCDKAKAFFHLSRKTLDGD